jgi:hypothetical protein
MSEVVPGDIVKSCPIAFEIRVISKVESAAKPVPGTGPSPAGWRTAVQKATSRGSAGASPRNFDWQVRANIREFQGFASREA